VGLFFGENMLEQVDARQVWERVEPMLDDLLAKTSQDWKPRDIYAACVNGSATAFMPDDDDCGILVVNTGNNPFTGEHFLFVWIAYHPASNAQELYSEQIETIARESGCSYIEFESKRHGFDRRGDWKAMNTTYRKKV